MKSSTCCSTRWTAALLDAVDGLALSASGAVALRRELVRPGWRVFGPTIRGRSSRRRWRTWSRTRSRRFERRRLVMDEWAAWSRGNPSSMLNDLRKTAWTGRYVTACNRTRVAAQRPRRRHRGVVLNDPAGRPDSACFQCHVMLRADVLEIRLEPERRDSHKTRLGSCPRSISVPAPTPETPENRRTPYVGP